MVELRQLRYFVAVAEELHFTRAAERLGITQPPLSQQIQKLESELGVSLMARSNRGVALTPAGEALLEGARRTLAEADRAMHRVQRVASGEVGTIALGTVSSTWSGLLPRILRRYREDYPDVEILISSLSTAEQIDRIMTGSLDIGFVRSPVLERDVQTEVLIPDALLVALPVDHPLAGAEEVELAELAGEPLVIFPRKFGPGGFDLIFQMCLSAGFTPKTVQEAVDLHACLGLVNAGMGVAIAPATIKTLHISGLAYVRLAGEHPTWDLSLVWRPDNISPAVDVFLDIAREVAADMIARGEHLP